MEQKKLERIGFINRMENAPDRMYGTLYWDNGEKYRISNIDVEGDMRIADVSKKTGEKYIDKTGVERDAYEAIGAVRFDVKAGTGEMVLNLDGLGPVKYPLQTYLDVDRNGREVRKLKFRNVAGARKVNAFRNMFDQAAEVTEERVNDDIPY
jgi:hypothetical protein